MVGVAAVVSRASGTGPVSTLHSTAPATLSPASMLNQPASFSAASRTEQCSILATRSKTFPRALQEKQLKAFLVRLIWKLRSPSPLWMGHLPRSSSFVFLSPDRL